MSGGGDADEQLQQQIELWRKWDKNPKTLNEIEDLVQRKEWSELRKRLCNRLKFGTAGIRGVMQAGFNSMNDLVIIQTAQGLAEYLKIHVMSSPGSIVLGYDGRHNSKRFAELTATVFVNYGFRIYLFSDVAPTPIVAFSVVYYSAMAGVVITASHNPKEDNGFKVYWLSGTQIIPPYDTGIQKRIETNLTPMDTAWDTSVLEKTDLIEDPSKRVISCYLETLVNKFSSKFFEINRKSDIKIVYSAMHGVGYKYIAELFNMLHLKRLLVVSEQRDPDPEFPTVKFPNPEEGKSALDLSIKKANAEGATLILANDPDADRLGCAEKDPATGQWKVFNGNELGALLGWWTVKLRKETEKNYDISKCCMLSSTVSSKILKTMAAKDGFMFVETLTGFKWMANRALYLLQDGYDVVLAFEEAIGFMVFADVRDKDGISAAAHVATMACYLKACEKLTLTQKLKKIYEEYGFHYTKNSYYFCYEAQTIKRIFQRIRSFENDQPATYPKSILNGEFTIKHVRDLTNGIDTSEADGKAKLPVSSSSEMITFTFENGLVVTLRTSGTEPKIKYYAEMCGKPEDKDWDKLRGLTDRMVTAIVEEFLQPELNNLTPKSD